MNKKILKQGLIVLSLMVGVLVLSNLVPVAFADLISGSDQPDSLRQATGGEGSIRALALRIVNYFLGFLGIVAVMMVIFGGITYVMAGGKQESIESGKKIIMYALVGIIIILLAFAIVNTVLGAAAGGGVTTPGA